MVVETVSVPYVALPLQMRRIKGELMAAVEDVLESGQYVMGPYLERFERQFADYCGVRYAVGVSDGTAALIFALRAIGVGPGDEVITAPNSFVASASCAALLGARPVFVDIRASDLNIDPEQIEAAITPRTKAIVPVHLAGAPADMDPINEVAGRHGIAVIEDAAQSAGTRYHGRRTGSLGVMGCFSFHPLKILHAYGDAGMVTTNDKGIYEWLLKARNHGLRNRDEVEFWSPNSRLDALQAALLSVKLDYLDEWIAERRAIAAQYIAVLHSLVEVPRALPGAFHIYNTFTIKADRQPDLIAYLAQRGVDAKIHYPLTIPMQPVAQQLGYRDKDYPVASAMSRRIVSLPLYAEMTSAQRSAVIDGVRSFYES